MKKPIILSLAVSFLAMLSSCEWEGTKPYIKFKTGTDYLSSDITLPKDSTVKICVEAEKAEDADVLKSFTFIRTTNGYDSTIVSRTLSGGDADEYSCTFPFKVGDFAGSKSGDIEKYTATVVNRDGLTGQVSLRITIK